jgi:hypothetical protein
VRLQESLQQLQPNILKLTNQPIFVRKFSKPKQTDQERQERQEAKNEEDDNQLQSVLEKLNIPRNYLEKL